MTGPNAGGHPPPDGTIEPPAGDATRIRARGRWVLVATILASGMVFIDTTAVNVILPVLQEDLGATANELQWVVESYQLFLAALMLVGGALGDIYGRRRVFLWGLALFTLASAASGLARTPVELVVARSFQGVGAALLTPGSLSIITSYFPAARRGKAIGYWAAMSGMTAALGPVLGGALAELVSWRLVFFINVPIGLVVGVATLARVPESRDEGAPRRLDPWGAGLATLGLGGIVFALIEGPHRGWEAALVLVSGATGVAALVAFLVHQARAAQPMVPLRLFRQRTFAAANGATLLVYAALSGGLFFLPFDLIQVQGYSPTMAGAAFVPFLVLITVLSPYTGSLADRHGPRKPMAAGALMAGAGLWLLALAPQDGNYWTGVFPGVSVLGLGMAFVVSPLTAAVMGAAPQRFAGLASGINNAVSRAAGLLAIAALGVLFTALFAAALATQLGPLALTDEQETHVLDQRSSWAGIQPPADVPERTATAVGEAVETAFVFAYRRVLALAGALAALGGVVSWAFVERKATFFAEPGPPP